MRHPQSRRRQRPWDVALEDQAVGDRGETEDHCSEHGDAIEIALNHSRTGSCRACAATEHVGETTAFAAVQKHKKDQGERRENVQRGDEPDHGRQDTETTGPIGTPDQAGSGSGLIDPVLDDPGEVLGIEARPTDQSAVDIGLGHEFGCVSGLYRAAVLDAHRLRRLRAEGLGDP